MTSAPENRPWARVEELFDAALDMAPEEREAWVNERCGDDRSLRDQLMGMLRAHERSTGFLERPLSITMATDPRQVIEDALAGRYRLDRELGRGGMAVVYLAHEHKHGRQVVLKVLWPGMQATGDIAGRFSREVRIIAQLAHPHLIGFIDSGEAAGLLYYVMPYVEGETLRARLRREGKLPLAESLNVLRDIAAGLAYAHQNAVVHRDLKPENVLCAASHTFLMDFGIAKILERTGHDFSATAEWAVIGTPGYMAPEQHVPGQDIDYRADIYSFGLIAREVLTGQAPIVGSPRLADMKLTFEQARIPAELQQLVDDCLQLDPADRPQSAAEILERLNGLRPGGAVAMVRRERTSRRMLWYAAGGLVAAIGIGGWLARPRPEPPPLPSPVVVASFINQTGDSTLDIWGRMAGDWVTQGLQETGLVAVVPWPVALLASERHARESGGSPLVNFIRDETGAGTVITGSYYLVGDSLQFRVEAIDAALGRTIGAPAPVVVPRDSAVVAIREVRDRLMGTVGIFTNDFIDASRELSRRPPRFNAYVAFDQAIQAARSQDYAGAAVQYSRAYQLDTTFTAALLYQATALWNDGAFEKVDSLLGVVRPRLSELSEYHRNWFTYLEATSAGDGSRALAAARTTAEQAPGSMAWYNLGLTALRTGRVTEAVEALTRLDPDRSEMRGWSSYWTQLAHARHMAGDHELELAAARELRARYPDRRVGLTLEARALAVLGRLAALDSALEVASTQPPTTYWSQGAAMVVAGEELLAHGKKEEGRRYLARGINWLRAELALRPGESSHQYWLASALYSLNRWTDAAALFEQMAKRSPARTDYSWLTALAKLRAGADSASWSQWLRSPSGRERGDFDFARARVALIRGQREAALSLLADALRFGVDGLPWEHGSAVRDLEMIGELKAQVPAGIFPEAQR